MKESYYNYDPKDPIPIRACVKQFRCQPQSDNVISTTTTILPLILYWTFERYVVARGYVSEHFQYNVKLMFSNSLLFFDVKFDTKYNIMSNFDF